MASNYRFRFAKAFSTFPQNKYSCKALCTKFFETAVNKMGLVLSSCGHVVVIQKFQEEGRFDIRHGSKTLFAGDITKLQIGGGGNYDTMCDDAIKAVKKALKKQ